jgi:hypothetical protein
MAYEDEIKRTVKNIEKFIGDVVTDETSEAEGREEAWTLAIDFVNEKFGSLNQKDKIKIASEACSLCGYKPVGYRPKKKDIAVPVYPPRAHGEEKPDLPPLTGVTRGAASLADLGFAKPVKESMKTKIVKIPSSVPSSVIAEAVKNFQLNEAKGKNVYSEVAKAFAAIGKEVKAIDEKIKLFTLADLKSLASKSGEKKFADHKWLGSVFDTETDTGTYAYIVALVNPKGKDDDKYFLNHFNVITNLDEWTIEGAFEGEHLPEGDFHTEGELQAVLKKHVESKSKKKKGKKDDTAKTDDAKTDDAPATDVDAAPEADDVVESTINESGGYLDDLFEPGVPADQQSAAIEDFFDPENPIFKGTDIRDDSGSDEESKAMINYALQNIELSPRVKAMLISWREDGF